MTAYCRSAGFGACPRVRHERLVAVISCLASSNRDDIAIVVNNAALRRNKA